MQGLGEDVLADVLRACRPSHVVTLQTPNLRRNLPAGHFWLLPDDDSGPLAAPVAAAQAAIVQLPAVAPQSPAGSIATGEQDCPLRQDLPQFSRLKTECKSCNRSRWACLGSYFAQLLLLHRSKWAIEAASNAP